jgi:hypothetical protein
MLLLFLANILQIFQKRKNPLIKFMMKGVSKFGGDLLSHNAVPSAWARVISLNGVAAELQIQPNGGVFCHIPDGYFF